MKCYIETLGCARNQVDSEVLAGHLSLAGFPGANHPEDAEIIVINTCGFIQDAIDDSIDTILELAAYRREGPCRYLIVAGCLPERFQEDILESLPEVDFFAGTAAYFSILSFLEKGEAFTRERGNIFCPDPVSAPLQTAEMERHRAQVHTAYLKVAEGCSRHCTYCIIPMLRGVQRSRSLEDIVAEARNLTESGVRELVLVAQETTDWGRDLAGGRTICDLVRAVCDAVGDGVWVRLLYGHPESLSDDLLDLMAEKKNFCSYLDLPVQHASDTVLRRMGRHYTRRDLHSLFSRIREKVEDVVLRTTLITGFPGESEEDFQELLAFVRTMRFDHLGVFTYSDMEDLPSHHLKNHVPPELAAARRDAVMEVQARISWEKNRQRLGKRYPVLIEKLSEGELAEGRTPFQAPEVDGITYVDGSGFQVGDVVLLEITDAFDYDLAGNVVDGWEV
ncbi:ribosomal protein S12 methylthiotransferase [Desulfobotulus alkaliphilus]|uniref:Ribosomal protein uS12 methylthiotransferase RimO n=1 Tax=Desulfobotulus alkaliphilus TaxID=622671 RepID=A0A562S0P6_9BACT|nr:30S ribosomal protein S12 methylthiotransferase RimO [Desulfobotulus alkaliphilus]TWI74130.1 ribosomal protein S12 methylthiotransferase [Desulfobotulus alkaliphilus]